MGRINIELPDHLHKELKVMATRNDRTLKKQVIHSLGENADVDLEED